MFGPSASDARRTTPQVPVPSASLSSASEDEIFIVYRDAKAGMHVVQQTKLNVIDSTDVPVAAARI